MWILLKPVCKLSGDDNVTRLKIGLAHYRMNSNLTLSWWRSLPYRNQSIDFLWKSMDWLICDKDLRHKSVKVRIFRDQSMFSYGNWVPWNFNLTKPMNQFKKNIRTLLAQDFALVFFEIFMRFKFRSRHRKCSVKKGVLKNFSKFTGKHLCQSLLFNKVASFRPAALVKKRLWHGCFPVNFEKFLRTPFFIEHLWANASTSGICI